MGIVLAPVIFVVAVALALLSCAPKGKAGEKVVKGKLRGLPEDKYIVLNNVMLETPKGTSQIDHVVLSVYGIFVIETKFYKGRITGGEDSEYWMQNVYGTKNTFYNPILQNGGHVRALARTLRDFGDLPFIPIVTFSEQAELRVEVSNAHVVYWKRIMATIRHYTQERLSWKEVNDICDYLLSVKLNASNDKIAREHIRNVRRAKEQKRNSESSGRCPRCGGRLVERNGRYGKFLGCSNYPDCKFTQPL